MNTETNEADYNPQDWQGALKHKHSFTGKAEKKIDSIRRRGKKWYAKKGIWGGMAFGLVVGWLIFQVVMK